MLLLLTDAATLASGLKGGLPTFEFDQAVLGLDYDLSILFDKSPDFGKFAGVRYCDSSPVDFMDDMPAL